jgi:hypothetical protein
MTTLTIKIPDSEIEHISKIIRKAGGDVISKIDDDLSEEEKKSLTIGIEEAKLIKEGKLKALKFDELWD